MDWVCSGCGRHFNWSVSECPYCRHQTTITTGGTQPTSNQQIKAVIPLKETLEILESHCDYMTDDKWDGMKQELEEMAKTTLS